MGVKRKGRLARRAWLKFAHAFSGFAHAFREEKASLIVHVMVAAVTLVVAGVLHASMSWVDWAIVVLVIGSVIGLELINTAVENAADLISLKYNTDVRKIKDVAAAATLTLSLAAVAVGMLILVPKIVAYFQPAAGAGA